MPHNERNSNLDLFLHKDPSLGPQRFPLKAGKGEAITIQSLLSHIPTRITSVKIKNCDPTQINFTLHVQC